MLEIEDHKRNAVEKIDYVLHATIKKILGSSSTSGDSGSLRITTMLDVYLTEEGKKNPMKREWPHKQSYDNPITAISSDNSGPCLFGFTTKDGDHIGYNRNTVDFNPDAVRQIKIGWDPNNSRMNRMVLLNSDGEEIIRRGCNSIFEEYVIDIEEGERFVGVSQQYQDPQRYYQCFQLIIASK